MKLARLKLTRIFEIGINFMKRQEELISSKVSLLSVPSTLVPIKPTYLSNKNRVSFY